MKKLRIFFMLLIWLFFSIGIVYSDNPQPTATAQEGAAGEVVSTGQLQLKIETEKPDIVVHTDANEVAEQVVKTESNILGLSMEDIKDVKVSLPETFHNSRADYYPEISYLKTPPVFKLKPKINKDIELEKWSFKITDPTGYAVKTLRGGGSLPDEIVWEGFDDSGQIIKVGAPYSYIFSVMDKAGNPNSIIGNPKVIDAIKYEKEGKTFIVISNKFLFDKDRKDNLTNKGQQILNEVENYIKMANNFPVTIQVFSDDKNLAGDQIYTVEKVLTNDLKLKKDIILKEEPYADNNMPKNYRTVFIIKNE